MGTLGRMPPAPIIVPSDITILEEKNKIGRRRLGILEQTGLLCTMPMIHIHYSKMDRGDKRAVLAKKYDPEDESPVVDILRRRQASLRKDVISKNFLWAGGWAFGGMSYWSFRRCVVIFVSLALLACRMFFVDRYNYQSRLIAFPFLFYLGTFAGRVVGGVVTGKNAEYGRDQFLGKLPAKVLYSWKILLSCACCENTNSRSSSQQLVRIELAVGEKDCFSGELMFLRLTIRK